MWSSLVILSDRLFPKALWTGSSEKKNLCDLCLKVQQLWTLENSYSIKCEEWEGSGPVCSWFCARISTSKVWKVWSQLEALSLSLVLCWRLLAPGFCPLSSLPYLTPLLHPSLQIQKNRSKKGAASVGDSVSFSSSHACHISCQCCWALFSLNMMRQVRKLDCSPVSAVFRIMIFLFSIVLFSPTPCDLRSVQSLSKSHRLESFSVLFTVPRILLLLFFWAFRNQIWEFPNIAIDVPEKEEEFWSFVAPFAACCFHS